MTSLFSVRIPRSHATSCLHKVLWVLAGTWASLCTAQPQSMAAAIQALEPRVMACTVCHGKEGRATPDGYFPRIAGKPQGYLYNQLLNFRDGRQSYPAMPYLLQHLTDGYLQQIASHFAGLDIPYSAPLPPQGSPALLEQGRRLVQSGDMLRGIPACTACHGVNMTGVAPFIPGLLGLPRDYLNGQLGAWATGQRRAQAPDCMARIARALTPEDVSAVSAWLAAQSVPDRGRPALQLPQPMPEVCGGVEAAEKSQALAKRNNP